MNPKSNCNMGNNPQGIMNIYEIIRRRHQGRSISGIANTLNLDRKTVSPLCAQSTTGRHPYGRTAARRSQGATSSENHHRGVQFDRYDIHEIRDAKWGGVNITGISSKMHAFCYNQTVELNRSKVGTVLRRWYI
jgi:hypothetical protein